jgi:translation initiation factor IF-3
VRLIGEDGNQIGVVPRDEALKYAQQRDLDLVEVAAEARPPVCRVLDYSKYKYEQEQKAKSARKHQSKVTVREIKLRPKIAENDYATKKGHVERFLKHHDKVKVTIMFRGREMTHPERGERLLLRLADEVQELGQIEQRPSQDGRNMTMTLAPLRAAGETPPEGAAQAHDGDSAEETQPRKTGGGSRRERGELPQQQQAHSQQQTEPQEQQAEPQQPEAEPQQPEAEPQQPEAEPPQQPAEPEPAPQKTEPDAGESPTAGGF